MYLVSWLAMLIALALTVISMLDYFVKAKEILGFAPSGKRAKRRAGAGEAAAADVGIAGGNGKGLLFRHGKVVKQVPQEAMVEELMALIETL